MVRELQKTDPTFSDHKMVLITSGNASEKLKSHCESQDIKLLVGSDLVEWIYDHLSYINAEWRQKLGLGRIGELVL